MRMVSTSITICVGLVMLLGAGLTHHYRMKERKFDPPGTVYLRGEGLRAQLPKWDDKNWKGLVHRP